MSFKLAESTHKRILIAVGAAMQCLHSRLFRVRNFLRRTFMNRCFLNLVIAQIGEPSLVDLATKVRKCDSQQSIKSA